ncbi:MAG TPA: hypothetical protein VJ866_23480 [Pyrinomonadaceae bacterium]|nr:hypothetical protein [Pyrinomonadaceae bacterium]
MEARVRRPLSVALAVLLAASSFAAQTSRRAPAGGKPTTARFIVRVVFDEEFRSTTDKPNEIDANRPHDTAKAESRLHLEMQASRWIKIQPGDGGSTELLALEGGEPSSAGGLVTFAGSQESRSDNGTGDRNRVESVEEATANFTGKVVAPDVIRDDSPVTLYVPQFSDDGGGLEFRLKVAARMTGGCHSEATWDGGSKKTDDCGEVNVPIKPDTAENREAHESPQAGYVAEVQEDFDFHPAAPPSQTGGASTEMFEQASAWYGAQTRGDRQSGYKITLGKTKTLKHTAEHGVADDWTQKISLDAEIVPGSPAASLERGGAETAAAPRLPCETPAADVDRTKRPV